MRREEKGTEAKRREETRREKKIGEEKRRDETRTERGPGGFLTPWLLRFYCSL